MKVWQEEVVGFRMAAVVGHKAVLACLYKVVAVEHMVERKDP